MDEIWTLIVSLGAMWSAPAVSAQDSSRAFFVVTGPETLLAGVPTSLAVTSSADFPGRVMIEVAHGNTKVVQTEEFQGGSTGVITLPPVYGPLTQSALFNLTVRGYKGDSLVFTNSTTLPFSPRNVSSFIQTDRTHYQPGDTVKVRVASLRWDHHPYQGRVDASVLDPSGEVVDRREATGNLGIVLWEFPLSQMAIMGKWTIAATANGATDERTFTVEDYERPPFEMLVKTALQVLEGDAVSGSVRVLYSSGQPVHGTLVVSVSLASATHETAPPSIPAQTKEIYGSTQFFFSKDLLQTLYSSPGIGSVLVAACVTDSSTGLKVNQTAEVQVQKNRFLLEFHDFPSSLKPSLYFSSTLSIRSYNSGPLSSEDLINPAVIEVVQETTTMNNEATTLTLPVPEDGKVHVKFRLKDKVLMLFIRAKFQSSEETLRVSSHYSSPTGSYIQVSANTSAAQIGVPLQLEVESSFQPSNLHYVVSSRGQVVAAGTGDSSSFSLMPTLSWSPEACVTVYCVHPDGELISDTVHVATDQPNPVSLKWSSETAHPGEQVSLTVTAAEPRFQLGVMVMGTHRDTPRADLSVRVKQNCKIKMLTNAVLQQHQQPDVPVDGHALTIETSWRHWMDDTESLLWIDSPVSENTWTSEKLSVPDGFTALRAVALVMSDNLGLGFTPAPQQLMVTKDFSLSLNVPSRLVRGEEIVLEVHVINHLERDLEVILLLAQSETFEFVLANSADMSVVNAQKLTLGSHLSAVASFPIRLVALGMVDITVDAVSAEASDSLVWRVLVQPGGVERSFSKTLFLELPPLNHNISRSLSFSTPPHVVPGSQRTHVALVGDILALSISHLDSLVEMPLVGGDQNMILFAPSIYVLLYLDKSTQDNQELRSLAVGYMKEGYQRQVSYQREDGSFSPFGDSDSSGSTWFTAFVLRCFHQAQAYMRVNQSVLFRAVTWLLKHQGPLGEFSEKGRLIHTEMQAGLDDAPVALTAYVLMALLEDESYVVRYAGNISLAQKYLEDKVTGGGLSNYSMCLAAYALALANSPVASAALNELRRRADLIDGVMMWSSSAGPPSPDWPPRSAQVEMTSYVLLALFRRGNVVEGIELMKWLSEQRNRLGSYGTTQDTIVALQALAYYAAFSGAKAIDLGLSVSTPTSPVVSQLHINSTNFLAFQSQEIDADKDVALNIYMEGRGFAILQLNVFYNLDSGAFSQHATEKEAFSLDVAVAEEADHNHMLLSICTRLKDSQALRQTGMVIVEAGMLSGFRLPPGAAAPEGLIRKVENQEEKVTLYLDSVNKSEMCIGLPLHRYHKVARVQAAVVQVYDYYEPTRRATRVYNSDILATSNSCFFCGLDCARCLPGMSVVISSSHSVCSATCCVFYTVLAAAAFFIVA
ncbi:CD109 antigen-like [Takifugu rubripes]|nr:CD109 antigen-like [Takifugu rubripes]